MREKNALIGNLYDAPIWKDWLTYLTAVALLAAPGAVSGGGAIDLLFALLFQFALFGVVPGSIRRNVRSRRAASERG